MTSLENVDFLPCFVVAEGRPHPIFSWMRDYDPVFLTLTFLTITKVQPVSFADEYWLPIVVFFPCGKVSSKWLNIQEHFSGHFLN